jgi:hypothetical protein
MAHAWAIFDQDSEFLEGKPGWRCYIPKIFLRGSQWVFKIPDSTIFGHGNFRFLQSKNQNSEFLLS